MTEDSCIGLMRDTLPVVIVVQLFDDLVAIKSRHC